MCEGGREEGREGGREEGREGGERGILPYETCVYKKVKPNNNIYTI